MVNDPAAKFRAAKYEDPEGAAIEFGVVALDDPESVAEFQEKFGLDDEALAVMTDAMRKISDTMKHQMDDETTRKRLEVITRDLRDLGLVLNIMERFLPIKMRTLYRERLDAAMDAVDEGFAAFDTPANVLSDREWVAVADAMAAPLLELLQEYTPQLVMHDRLTEIEAIIEARRKARAEGTPAPDLAGEDPANVRTVEDVPPPA